MTRNYVSEFRKFLKEKKILKDFLFYSRLAKGLDNVEKKRNPFFWINSDITNPFLFITRAFLWRSTKQGYDFWDAINQEWEGKISKYM